MSDQLHKLLLAAEKMDWEQVVLNGGPPCFYLQEDGKFCGRAKRWPGHGRIGAQVDHLFVPLDKLIKMIGKK